MTGDGAIDRDSLARQVRWLLDAGASGLWVNGTTGEFHALDADERTAVVADVVAAASEDGFVIAQVGAPATRTAQRLAERAKDAGADWVAAVAPYYMAFDQAELMDYYRAVARAAGEPVVAYQIPLMTKVSLTVESVVELCAEGTIAGIKDSAGDIAWLRRLIERSREQGLDLRVFAGGGGMVDSSILAGAPGAMCAIANLVPRHCAGLVERALAGDWAEAARRQTQLNRLIEALRLPGRPLWGAATLPPYKHVLATRGLIAGETCSAPLRPLDAAERLRLRERALPLVEELETVAAPA
jgi:4-hydroxy-tetrahydrodipicolinate synthase